jgi:hypothetical protein
VAVTKSKSSDSGDAKVFDVAHPGTTAPSTTSKPVIVNNHQIIKDPMVNADEETTKTTQVVSAKVKIAPLSKPEDLKPTEAAPEAETEDTEQGSNEIKDATNDLQEVVDKKASEHQANLAKIAEARTYYLPINQIERRRSKQVVVVGAVLIILLGLAWADVALDAGLLTISGIKAPTHFFSK